MRISICGDVCPSQSNDLFVEGKVQELFNDVPSVFEDSDRVLVNLEAALTNSEYRISKKGPNLKGSPICAKVLKKIGVTDCGICNNHIYDFGVEGALETIKTLEENDLPYTGFGMNYEDSRKNLIFEKDGVKVAVIAVCEHEYCYALTDRMGARGYDPYDTMEDIRKAKAENDFVIVTYHGGKEQCVYPSPRLRQVCQAMARNGADVVLCQHSHCIGCYEQYQGTHILYGQGNFHFTKFNFVSVPEEVRQWQTGLIVQLDITDKVEIQFIPIKVAGAGIELAKGKERQEILEQFMVNSENLKTDEWLKAWKAFCESKRDAYTSVVSRAYVEGATEEENEWFNHYLYCEAHMDVFRELYKLSWETRQEP